ncbi:hypothetical protein F2P56_027010 [Juglans regia]|uniref:Uncharacterized protein n=1 Tax=Juglans regia TaxID=51240 RepID=A0A833U5X0_JUGRE|nr:hypothetical protein F2P56_027010 [Juglans regia]
MYREVGSNLRFIFQSTYSKEAILKGVGVHLIYKNDDFMDRIQVSKRYRDDCDHNLEPDWNPQQKIRVHSEILTLPDDISFDSDLGVVGGADGPSFSDETEEDLLSIYLDMDKFKSSSAMPSFQVGEPSSAATAPSPALTSMVTPASGAVTAAENVAIGTNERPRVRHQHSQSMDGSMTIKPEMLVSGLEDISELIPRKP